MTSEQRPEKNGPDVTGMGKGFLDHSIIAVLSGAAATFGAGRLGAQVPPRTGAQPISKRMQWFVGVVLYAPMLVVPIGVWLLTGNWAQGLIWTGIVWVSLFFPLGLVAVVLGYRRSKAGRLD